MQALFSIIGNDALKESLSAALAAGRLSHSILLCGEQGTGAGYAARCLAADYLYPEGGDGARMVLSGQSPECLTLEGEGASGEIRVERVREVRRAVFNTALSAKGRVVFIKGAHRLNEASANALLKVLEEPPEGVLFVLTSPGEANVMATIRSRCCIYTLAPVPQAACAQYLERSFPGQDAARYAALFGGRIGTAKRCMEDPVQRAFLRDAMQAVQWIENKDRYSILVLFAKYETDRAKAQTLLRFVRTLCSAALRESAQAGVPLSPKRAGVCIEAAGRALQLLAGNVSSKLVLTNLAGQITREIPAE